MPELSPFERSTPFRVGIALAYLLLNTSLNMLNRWALGQCARTRRERFRGGALTLACARR